MKKKIFLIFLVFQQTSLKSNNPAFDLRMAELKAAETQFNKQIQFEKERSTGVSTTGKKALYAVGIAFILGTAGFYRKFTWVSDKVFKAKDWTNKKFKDIYKTLRFGRKVQINADDLEELLKLKDNCQRQQKIIDIILEQTGIEIEPEPEPEAERTKFDIELEKYDQYSQDHPVRFTFLAPINLGTLLTNTLFKKIDIDNKIHFPYLKI